MDKTLEAFKKATLLISLDINNTYNKKEVEAIQDKLIDHMDELRGLMGKVNMRYFGIAKENINGLKTK